MADNLRTVRNQHGLSAPAVITSRVIAFGVGLATLLFGTEAFAAELSDPLAELTSSKSTVLCYRRDYSLEHLAQHPKQTIQSVLLAYQGWGLVTVVLTPRMGSPEKVFAGCGWRQGAGTDTSDRKMIPNFNKSAGLDCIVTLSGSAEEGGYLLIDPAKDAASLTLFLQSPITSYAVKPRNEQPYNLKLGPEDRTFALTRTDAKSCDVFRAVSE